MKKFLVYFLCLSLYPQAWAMNVGFNQAWFKINYSQQYLDDYFDPREVERIFELTQNAGGKQLRLWLFEGSDFPMLNWNGSEVQSVRSDFVRNFVQTLRIARKYDVKVYMTLIDAHSYRPDKLSSQELKKLRQFFNPEGGRKFLTRVILPLLQEIEKEGLSSQISKIDLVNEGETVINRWGFNLGWKGAEQMICDWRSFIKSIKGFYSTPVTFSLRLHPLVLHPANLLGVDGPMRCADVIDFHSYSDKGKIHRCQYVKRFSQRSSKPVILGEFGQSFFNHRYDDALHVANTKSYLQEAQNCGFSEALAWRLSDVRPGHNKEARYSFEAYGKPREAYYEIQRHNQSFELKNK
jgi:hypothetical protein